MGPKDLLPLRRKACWGYLLLTYSLIYCVIYLLFYYLIICYIFIYYVIIRLLIYLLFLFIHLLRFLLIYLLLFIYLFTYVCIYCSFHKAVKFGSHHSALATGWTARKSGSIRDKFYIFHSSSKRLDQLWFSRPLMQRVTTTTYWEGLKREGHKAGHSSPCISVIEYGRSSIPVTNLIHKFLYSYNVTILYMFRAVLCSSSGGQIVCIQHMVSLLSMSGHREWRYRYTYNLTSWWWA